MRVRVAALILLCFAGIAQAQTKVATLLADWRDKDRDRILPVKVYYPAQGKGPFPIVIVSHGLGGSREGLKYLGDHLAANGYVTVHPTHVGSDISIVRGRNMNEMSASLMKGATLEQAIARCDDVSFLLDELTRQNRTPKSPLAGKLNLDRIAMAGHSFGAITTAAICGQVFPIKPTSRADPRVKCGVAFSPSPPKAGDAKTAFAQVEVPMLHMTGTLDTTPIPGDASADERRVPFDHMNGSDQYLVILTGGDHMIFGGSTLRRRLRGGRDGDDFIEIIEKTTLAFLDAYLKDDEKQKSWLQNDAKPWITPSGTFEMKLVPAAP